MSFEEVLAQVIDWLQQDGRVSYRALKRQFDLDDHFLDDLTYELVDTQKAPLIKMEKCGYGQAKRLLQHQILDLRRVPRSSFTWHNMQAGLQPRTASGWRGSCSLNSALSKAHPIRKR